MPVTPCQAIDQGSLLRGQAFLIDEAPVALVERESLLAGNLAERSIPGEQCELWVVVEPQSVIHVVLPVGSMRAARHHVAPARHGPEED